MLLGVLTACQSGADAPAPPGVLTDPAAIGAALPACRRSVLDPSPLHAPQTCRSEGQRDLDGDGVDDCWRVVTTRAGATVAIWPRCAGASSAFELEAGGPQVVELPPAIKSQAWARGVAEVLVGADRVMCETPAARCHAPDPLMQWIAEMARPHGPNFAQHYTPIWQEGSPAPPEAEALILDPRQRDQLGDAGTLPLPLLGNTLVVFDPRDRPRYEDDDFSFRLRTECDRWQLWAGAQIVAAVDRATGRWSWVLVRGFRSSFDELECADGMVLATNGHGTDTHSLLAIDPVAGNVSDSGYGGRWQEQIAAHWLTTAPPVSTRQLRALMQRDPPCPANLGAPPLFALHPDGRCTLEGRADFDGDGVADCWTAEHVGNHEAGTLQWRVNADRSCGDSDTWSFRLSTSATAYVEQLGASWAELHAMGVLLVDGALTCMPAKRDCPLPDSAAQWVIAWIGTTGATEATIAPRWIAGTPVAPERALVLVEGREVENTGQPRALVAYNPTAESIGTGELAPRLDCAGFAVWSSPAGVAVVDRKRARWAWSYVASDSLLRADGAWTPPVASVACSGNRIVATLGNGIGMAVTIEPHSGAFVVTNAAP